MNLLNLFNDQPKTFDVSQVKYKKPIDQQLVNKLIDYLKQAVKQLSRQGLHKIMLGMIGGEFEYLLAHLLKQALRQDFGELSRAAQGKQAENIIVLIFDFDDTQKTNRLIEICKQLSIASYILKRGQEYRYEAQSYHLHTQAQLTPFYHRFLNYHLSTQADLMKAGVVGTLDKSGRLLGLRGSLNGHLTPFYSLYKSEIYDLAKFLGLPYQPTLYQDHLYQNIPLPWDKIDPILYLLTEKQLKPEEISQAYKIDIHWLRSLRLHVNKQLFQPPISQFII